MLLGIAVSAFHYNKDYNFICMNHEGSYAVSAFHYNKDYNPVASIYSDIMLYQPSIIIRITTINSI